MRYSMDVQWKLLLLPFASMLSSSLCAPLQPSSPGLMGNCYDYEIPVITQTQAQIFGLPKFSDNFDVSGLFGNLIKRTPFNPFAGTQNVTGNYTISATFCSPKTLNGHEKTVLLATSGLGYDSRYWAPSMNPAAYSFVDYTLSRGYSIFVYDRLGTGKSTKSAVSGYSDPQASTQLAILKSLTDDLKKGLYAGDIGQPSKIVHIGHSYGSILTHTLVSTYPNISDGIVLTGQTTNVTDFPAFFEAARLDIANTVSPGKYQGLDSGYLVYADIIGNAAAFFHPGNYDKEILWYTQDIAQPSAIMEFITGQPKDLGSTEFTGPVMVVNGEFDGGNCAGDCNGVTESNKEMFKLASAFEAVVQPGAGHAINFCFNATGAYSAIMDFVTKNGL
ncbi:hypothetical protein BP5796_05009 [Coleophoma crateriformis]|uniref:AB hydrolase-1 domain-containing protein n=1 Tax=Coleophoma crateriformis TaxID=565419 RepID=A0A3D8SCL4_9HELO|nr:hypothetical protein BP5796_05009 [Coleophoma crateriformis]